MTSDEAGLDVDLNATMGADGGNAGEVERGVGVPEGRLLIDFAEAVVGADDNVESLRNQLVERVGPAAAGHAAATICAFSGLVRVADGTGIPIDDGLAAVSVGIRRELALQELGGAANSDVDTVAAAAFTTIDSLFDNG